MDEHHCATSARDFGARCGVADPARLDGGAEHACWKARACRVGLLTTRGFRDVYEIGRQWRGDEVFNIFAPAPKMLLTRDRIHEIARAARCAGQRGRAARCRRRRPRRRASWLPTGVEAIAVCFLFAYANPAHEQAAADIIRGIAPDLYVSLSHEVNPEWREYERTASTVANAYIGPPVARYLHDARGR